MNEHGALLAGLTRDRARFVSLARRRLGSEADAEDVVQRALVRAAERAASLEDPARAVAWFYRILRHTLADHHRARGRDPLGPRATGDLGEIAAHLEATAGRACPCVAEVLGGLRPAYREVLARVDRDGEDPRDVAKVLGLTPGNLHVRLHRARRALQAGVVARCGVASSAPCRDCSCGPGRRCAEDHPARSG